MEKVDVCVSRYCFKRLKCKLNINHAIMHYEPDDFVCIDFSNGKSMDKCGKFEEAK